MTNFSFVDLQMLKFSFTRKYSAGCTLLGQRSKRSSLYLVNALTWRFSPVHYTPSIC